MTLNACKRSVSRELKKRLLNPTALPHHFGAATSCKSIHSTALPAEAEAVVLGAGVIGSSVAYHLAERGLSNVALIEAKQLAETGATHHSPGLVTPSTQVHRYKRILADSVELYAKLEKMTGERIHFTQSGTLRLASTPQKLRDFQIYCSRDYFYTTDACKTTLITPEEIKELVPFMDTSDVKGGLYTTNGGFIDAQGLARAMASAAVKAGATFTDNCGTMTIKQDSDLKWIVETDAGVIRSKHLINSAGLWLRDVAAQSGVDLPIVHFQHQYAVISPVKELSDAKPYPALLDHERQMYLRSIEAGVVIGGFEQRASALKNQLPAWYDGIPADQYHEESLVTADVTIAPSFDRIREQYNRACELLPVLKDAPVQEHCGVFCMTPNAFPLLGPVHNCHNYWVAGGFFDGISAAGGAGKFLANYLIDKEPPYESFDLDVNRYSGWTDKKFVLERTTEAYRNVYHWSRTESHNKAGRPTGRVSGSYGALMGAGAQMRFRHGWEAPAYFSIDGETEFNAVMREYQLVTNKVGLIDLAHKGKIEVRGKDSTKLLDFVLSNRPPPFQNIKQSLLLTPSGKIQAAFKVLHHDQFRSEFVLLTDPEHELRDLAWLKHIKRQHNFDVQVNAVSEYLASMAVIGPMSRHVIAQLAITDVSEQAFPPNTTKLIKVHGVPCIAARASGTGELGFELFHNRAESLKLYHGLMAAGKEYGITNFGTTTLNALRIEKGFKLWGRELSLDTNPYEAGIDSFVDMTKDDFIGKKACQRLMGATTNRRLVLLQCELSPDMDLTDTTTTLSGKHIPTGWESVRIAGSDEKCGQVTSGCFSPRLQTPLCFAWLSNDVKDDAQLTVDMSYVRLGATILPQAPGSVETS